MVKVKEFLGMSVKKEDLKFHDESTTNKFNRDRR